MLGMQPCTKVSVRVLREASSKTELEMQETCWRNAWNKWRGSVHKNGEAPACKGSGREDQRGALASLPGTPDQGPPWRRFLKVPRLEAAS